jgi:hypothetical protein
MAQKTADMVVAGAFAVGIGAVAGISAKIYGWSTLASVTVGPAVAVPLLFLLVRQARKNAEA